MTAPQPATGVPALPTWLRAPAVVAATPYAAFLVTCALLSGGDPKLLRSLPGPVASVRGALAGGLLVVAVALLAGAVVRYVRERRDVARTEDHPELAMWASRDGLEPDHAPHLAERVGLAQWAVVEFARPQWVALAALSVWMFVGADGLVAGLLLGALFAAIPVMAHLPVLVGVRLSDSGRLDALRRAARKVPLELLHADAIVRPAGDVLLARAGAAPGSDVATVASRLAQDSPDLPLLELVDVAAAIAAQPNSAGAS